MDGFTAKLVCRKNFAMADAAKKSVDGWVQRLDDVLHDKNYWFVAQLDMLEEKTKVKRLYFALGK